MYPFTYFLFSTTNPPSSFVDPEDLFGAIFGGAAFVPIIGHISLAKDMKEALQEADDELGECRACGVSGAVDSKDRIRPSGAGAQPRLDAQGRPVLDQDGRPLPLLDAKGRPILSEEEKKRREERKRRRAEEVCAHFFSFSSSSFE